MRSARRSPWLACSASLLLLTLSTACERASVEQTATTGAVPVTVEAAKTDTLQSTIAASGVVAAAPGAELIVIAPENARIAELPKAEGEAVKAGDVLVRFEIPTLTSDAAAKRAAVAQASARVDAARASYTRLSSLLAQGVAAPREVEDAKRQQAEAEADLEQARSAVDASSALSARAVVHATFAGIVAKRFHNPGDMVEGAASDPVLRVINPAQLQVVAAVPVGNLSKIVVGHRAQVRLPGHDDTEEARVLTKAAQVDATGAAADVRLGFVKPTSLPAGATVEVDIVGDERKNVIVIQTAAVVEDEGEIFVMVAGDDNKAHKYPVSLGLATRTMTEVTSGLKVGDRVIVRGQAELPEGAAITIEGK